MQIYIVIARYSRFFEKIFAKINLETIVIFFTFERYYTLTVDFLDTTNNFSKAIQPNHCDEYSQKNKNTLYLT